MNRLTFIGALALVVLLIAGGLLWVMNKQEQEEVASDLATESGTSSATATPEANAGTPGAQAKEAIQPSFDVVRVNPNGDTVIAGRASPKSEVTIFDDGAPIGSTIADESGAWVFLPKSALGAGSHHLTLESSSDAGTQKSEREVMLIVPDIARDIAGRSTKAVAGALAVELPLNGKGAVRILNLPNQGGVSDASLSIDAVDYDAEDVAIFSGRAPAGAKLMTYLDNQPIAQIAADDKGDWSLEQKVLLGKDTHLFRIDRIDDQGKVLGRAEISFDLSIPSVNENQSMNETIVVRPGQSLWLLARRNYGKGMRYTLIFDANREQIKDPDLIFPGQVLTIPRN